MIVIDGAQGEGGGQMLRTALALSAVSQEPFRMTNIRSGRDVPGLKPQHLAAVKTVQKLCNAVVEGDAIGSTELTFFPKPIKGGAIEIDVGTAGSVTLVLHAAVLPSLFAKQSTRLLITGGTDVEHALSIDYFSEVFLPQMRGWCEKIEVKLIKRGYYPAGGGQVELFVKPKIKRSEFETFDSFVTALRAVVPRMNLSEQGHLMLIKGVSHASHELERDKVAERQANAALAMLMKRGDVKIISEYVKTSCSGSGLTLWAIYSILQDDIEFSRPIRLGSCVLSKDPEETGKNAALRLIDAMDSLSPVDEHLGDMLVPFVALATGSYAVANVTEHTRTNVSVVNRFCPDVVIDGNKIKKLLQV